MKLIVRASIKGSGKSGFRGHAGRPGKIGGSARQRLRFDDIEIEFPKIGEKNSALLREIETWEGDRQSFAHSAILDIQGGKKGLVFKTASGEAVGVLSYEILEDGTTLYADHFATKMPGVGKAAMAHTVHVALEEEAEDIALVASPSAFGFYDKIGMLQDEEGVYSWNQEDMIDFAFGFAEEKAIDEEPEDGIFTIPRKKKK